MITLIILIVLTGIGIYIIKTSWDYEGLGILMSVIFGVCLLIHTIGILKVNYDYGIFVVKRDAFEKTLTESRKKGNDFETAAIVKEVAEWNVKLAEYKYDNTIWYFDQYVDDRIESLDPIE